MLDSPDLLFGVGEACQRLLEDAASFALTPWPILLVGPTGSGKSVLARFLHAHSPRSGKPFVECSIPSITKSLAQAEWRGYRRGAFTGAVQDHGGYLELANSGTLFLDEFGFVKKSLQQMLLTLLEATSIRRIGDERDRPLDVRFIVATTADPRDQVRDRRMLPELFYRLGYFILDLPALRDRTEDIIPLAKLFLTRAFQVLGRAVVPEFSEAALEELTSQEWPGNIRQLHSACLYIASRIEVQRPITVADLPAPLFEAAREQGTSRQAHVRVRAALARNGGNKRRTARELGVSPNTLYRLLADPDAMGRQDAQRES
jgi:two-component system, NtrC family, response regulator HydG